MFAVELRKAAKTSKWVRLQISLPKMGYLILSRARFWLSMPILVGLFTRLFGGVSACRDRNSARVTGVGVGIRLYKNIQNDTVSSQPHWHRQLPTSFSVHVRLMKQGARDAIQKFYERQKRNRRASARAMLQSAAGARPFHRRSGFPPIGHSGCSTTRSPA